MLIVDFSERPIGTNHTGPCYVFTIVVEHNEVNDKEKMFELFQEKLKEFEQKKLTHQSFRL